MSFLCKSATVPEREDDIKEFLAEISDFLNHLASGSGATGDLSFHIREPEANGDEWRIEVMGQISDGQDSNGREIWKETELQDYYSSITLKEAVEQIFSDAKSYYGASLP